MNKKLVFGSTLIRKNSTAIFYVTHKGSVRPLILQNIEALRVLQIILGVSFQNAFPQPMCVWRIPV